MEACECRISDFPFVGTEIRDQFYQLNVCKTMWSDVIHHRVVEELVYVISGYLLIVYQGSGESEEVPTDWKLASSIQIYKTSMRDDPGTYRPVSLISVHGKIMEKILLCSVGRHLKNNESLGTVSIGEVMFS